MKTNVWGTRVKGAAVSIHIGKALNKLSIRIIDN